jgi:predicted nucleotidyltransferase component of viral defense system
MTELLLEFLPDNTRFVFDILAKDAFISDYTLVGGTALALQMGHRMSEDLDFMTDKNNLDARRIQRNINRLFTHWRLIRKRDEQIDFLIKNTRVTFFTAQLVNIPFQVSSRTCPYHHLRIADIKTLALLKLSAISQRNTLRDYYDLYTISKEKFSLSGIFAEAKQSLPQLSPIVYTETLTYTDDIPEKTLANHLKPKQQISKEEIADYFSLEIKKYLNQNENE